MCCSKGLNVDWRPPWLRLAVYPGISQSLGIMHLLVGETTKTMMERYSSKVDRSCPSNTILAPLHILSLAFTNNPSLKIWILNRWFDSVSDNNNIPLQFKKDRRVPAKFDQGNELCVFSLSSWLPGGKATYQFIQFKAIGLLIGEKLAQY